MLTALIAILAIGSKTSVAKNIQFFTLPNIILKNKIPDYRIKLIKIIPKLKKNHYKANFIVTAYSADPSENGGTNRTRLGNRIHPGIVAVDPRIVPMNSRIYIPGVGMCIAQDTGGAIRGRHIDVCLSSRHQEGRFGRKHLEVIIYPSKNKLWKSRYHP